MCIEKLQIFTSSTTPNKIPGLLTNSATNESINSKPAGDVAIEVCNSNLTTNEDGGEEEETE